MRAAGPPSSRHRDADAPPPSTSSTRSGAPPSSRPRLSGPPPPERSGAGWVILAMLLVPLVTLGIAMMLVPTFRPWSSTVSTPTVTPSASASATEPEGAVRLRGRVVDGEGEPVALASVTVIGASGVRLREATTDTTGGFAFADLAGARRVRVIAEHDERGVVASAELVLGDEPVRDLVLALEMAHTVRGRVTTEDGVAVPEATVSVDTPAYLPRSAVTGDDGTYRLARVPSGPRTLHVSARGHGSVSVRLAEVPTFVDEVVDVKLRKEADIEGTVLDADGKPIRASVHACDGKDAAHRAVSGSDGSFRLSRELASCPLVAVHDAYAASDPVTPGSAPVVLKLKPGGGIAGNVVGEGGSVASFFVGVESFTPAFGGEFSVRSGQARAFKDPQGAFSLDKLAPGSYVLSYGEDGKPPQRSATIEVKAGQVTSNVRLLLARGGTVEGQVFDEDKHAPLAGARVSFDATSSARGETVTASTDAEGRFRLENAPSGPFSLRVDKDGYRSRILAGLKVESKDTLKQDVGLHAAEDGGSRMEFGGIGAVLTQTRDGIAVGAVFDGSPAEKAGLAQGDLLRKINGESVEGLSVSDAIQRLRGEVGSTVRMSVLRQGQSLEISITRALIAR